MGLRLDIPGLIAQPIRLLYLFGSRAAGAAAGPLSDYDLGVLLDPARDTPASHAQLAHELAIILDTERIDLVVLNRAPIELAYGIIAQGQLLYQRDLGTRVEYEADVLGRYGDYLPVLRTQREEILRGERYATRIRWYRAAIGRTERTLGQIGASHVQAAG